MKLNLEQIKTVEDVRKILEQPTIILSEFDRIVDFPSSLGKLVQTKVHEPDDWYTPYTENYKLEMEDGIIYVAAWFMQGNTENQSYEEVMDYDEIYEVIPKEKVIVEYIPVS